MSYNRAKNIYIGAIIITLVSFSGAALLHFVAAFADLAILKVILLGIGCGLISLVINLTKAGLLTALISETRQGFVPTQSTISNVSPKLKEKSVLNRQSA